MDAKKIRAGIPAAFTVTACPDFGNCGKKDGFVQ